jgi:hypothetical protein
MFWRKFSDLWLPGIVTGVIFTCVGAYVGWKISYEDTQTQISGLQQANRQLTDQKALLLEQKTASQAQAQQLAAIILNLAKQGHDLQLALDNHGNVTLDGHAIVDSQGKAILSTGNGSPIVTDSGQPILVH